MDETQRIEARGLVLSHTAYSAYENDEWGREPICIPAEVPTEEATISKVRDMPLSLRRSWSRSHDLDHKTQFVCWNGKPYRIQKDSVRDEKEQNAYEHDIRRDGTMGLGRMLLAHMKSQPEVDQPTWDVDRARVQLWASSDAAQADRGLESNAMWAMREGNREDLEKVEGHGKLVESVRDMQDSLVGMSRVVEEFDLFSS
ncbi:uncharacterized protein BDV14DRAFT_195369 [Aspergillus stella-maris]|uniref:uncharacterized protein n=1 Tax=Aspergillus stella-maris TaxID=1810926 RepID=UPI003CCD0B5F